MAGSPSLVDETVDLMTARALLDEHRLAFGCLRALRRSLVRSVLVVHPGLEVGIAEGDDLHPHVGV